MRLDAVTLALPSRSVANDDVVALVEHHSRATYAGDLDRLLTGLRVLLRRSGADHRYWLAPGEEVLPLVADAVKRALAAAGCARSEVDLLICGSVDRGFVEPATAYLLAQALELKTVSCFDVVDACNGWTRSLQLVDALLRTGAYRRALIVNAEFPMFEGGPIYPRLFSLHNRDEIAWSFAGYTLGEGVTATLLSADSDNKWELHLSSRPDLADRSTVPLNGYQRYCRPSERIGLNGTGHFVAFSREMFDEATREVAQLFRKLQTPISGLRAIFPHGATRRTWDEGGKLLGVDHLMYHVYPQYGNLISASLPAGLATAIDAVHLRRGDRFAICGASAGMSFAVGAFEY